MTDTNDQPENDPGASTVPKWARNMHPIDQGRIAHAQGILGEAAAEGKLFIGPGTLHGVDVALIAVDVSEDFATSPDMAAFAPVAILLPHHLDEFVSSPGVTMIHRAEMVESDD